MSLIALIFARGGSKGILKKNMSKLGDRPLVAHSIRHANRIDNIDRVLVATDSKEIGACAYAFGAEVLLRPDALCTDTADEWLSWQYALKIMTPDMFVSLPCTSPFRTHDDIDQCIAMASRPEVDLALTVTDAVIAHKMITDTNDLPVGNRQELRKVRMLAGSCYAGKGYIWQAAGMSNLAIAQVLVGQENALDIDTPYDLEVAQALWEKRYGRS